MYAVIETGFLIKQLCCLAVFGRNKNTHNTSHIIAQSLNGQHSKHFVYLHVDSLLPCHRIGGNKRTLECCDSSFLLVLRSRSRVCANIFSQHHVRQSVIAARVRINCQHCVEIP
jgi:hypothetical protein